MDSEVTLRSAGTSLTWVRDPPYWCPNKDPKSLRSSCCELVVYKNPNPSTLRSGQIRFLNTATNLYDFRLFRNPALVFRIYCRPLTL
ncbi:hypothetical protein PoB_004566600 [Plakobranchus ocellatus]|uniref:Uncharacterized protein n=1 Tax=Plakobranchus ocellatus TaxID=259542 RepID=A0AAV4BFG1_9GAST|nr:hypothetical protein PoB_004566600 [Plakobranchus ocellatus]